MKTYLYIDNYRGFSEQTIPLEFVNFLVGENSTGKSSVLDLLEIFSFPSFWLFEPKFGGFSGKSRHFHDLVSASAQSKSSFTVGALQLSEIPSEKCNGMIITYVNSEGRPEPSRISVLRENDVRTIDGRLWVPNETSRYKSRLASCTSSEASLRLKEIIEIHKKNESWKKVQLNQGLNGAPVFIKFSEYLFGKGDSSGPGRVPFPFGREDVNLAPIRTKTKRTYDAPQTSFSPEGEHTPYLIRKHLANKSQREEFKVFVDSAGKNSGLFNSLKIKSYGRSPMAPFELQVVLDKTAFSIDNVGYGVSQSLPVIVEMFVRPRRTLFSIQQPEVHLHPKAQAIFGDLVAGLARDEEKRFFVETHSDFLIDRFRLNVRNKGALRSQLLFFERVGGGNRIVPLAISPSGDLPDDQPDSYRDFFLNESLEMLG